MPPKARNGNDESSKADSALGNNRDGHGREKDGLNPAPSPAHQTHSNTNGGKMRRVASSAGTNLRESAAGVTQAATDPVPASTAAASASSGSAPGVSTPDVGSAGAALQWSSFERSVLHSYRRAYRLNTPTSFMTDYHRWVLSRPGSIGLQSPTMLRSKVFRRQGKDQLAGAVRKHFNSQAIQENDVIVDFLHKVGTTSASAGVSKPGRTRRKET